MYTRGPHAVDSFDGPGGPSLLMIAAGFGVYFSRGSLVGLEAGVVLLIAAFILKLVEMSTRRDALVLIFLGFFAVVTSYLFEDSLLAGLYSLLPVTALLAAMIGRQHHAPAARGQFTRQGLGREHVAAGHVPHGISNPRPEDA